MQAGKSGVRAASDLNSAMAEKRSLIVAAMATNIEDLEEKYLEKQKKLKEMAQERERQYLAGRQNTTVAMRLSASLSTLGGTPRKESFSDTRSYQGPETSTASTARHSGVREACNNLVGIFERELDNEVDFYRLLVSLCAKEKQALSEAPRVGETDSASQRQASRPEELKPIREAFLFSSARKSSQYPESSKESTICRKPHPKEAKFRGLEPIREEPKSRLSLFGIIAPNGDDLTPVEEPTKKGSVGKRETEMLKVKNKSERAATDEAVPSTSSETNTESKKKKKKSSKQERTSSPESQSDDDAGNKKRLKEKKAKKAKKDTKDADSNKDSAKEETKKKHKKNKKHDDSANETKESDSDEEKKPKKKHKKKKKEGKDGIS